MRIIDGSSDVCSSDLSVRLGLVAARVRTVDHRPVSGMGVQDMTHLVQQTEDDARIEYFLRQRVDGRVRPRVVLYPQRPQRSEQRRVGKDSVSPCSSLQSPYQ